jgi:hypothetical protein
MTTVLAVYNLKGCVGTCDARCYHAAKTSVVQCKCICGGRNHGKGREGVSTEEDEVAIAAFRDGRPELDLDPLIIVNRLLIPNAKDAREHAYMQLTQLDLFEERVA